MLTSSKVASEKRAFPGSRLRVTRGTAVAGQCGTTVCSVVASGRRRCHQSQTPSFDHRCGAARPSSIRACASLFVQLLWGQCLVVLMCCRRQQCHHGVPLISKLQPHHWHRVWQCLGPLRSRTGWLQCQRPSPPLGFPLVVRFRSTGRCIVLNQCQLGQAAASLYQPWRRAIAEWHWE